MDFNDFNHNFNKETDFNLSSNFDTPYESPLGRKDYWDKFYNQEILQFNNNSDLIGEIWFGEQVQNKISNFIKNKKLEKNIRILDVGCGNAAFLIKLYESGYTNLYGMDFSENSIKLAENILQEKFNDEYKNKIRLFQEDINSPITEVIDIDLIHDKGTFDAFMLSKENSEKSYIEYIIQKSKFNGTIFIITSCNFSKPELETYFNSNDVQSKFKLIEEIPHKSFIFGGQKGQTVTTLIFSIN